MELPIFNDNLKSSGNWTVRLAQELELYRDWRQSGVAASAPFRPGSPPPGLSAALVLVDQWATASDPGLDRERLAALNRVLREAESTADLLRQGPPPLLSELHDPAPASMLPRLLDLAFDWFTTEGFAELHPLEQATLVYLRLLDLSPFASENQLTALLAAGFHTRRAGFPVIIARVWSLDEAAETRYRQALEAAFRMLTQPLVEFFADELISAMQREREGGA